MWLTLKTGKNASPNTASFCKARARLPPKGLEAIYRRLTREIEAQPVGDWLWRQRRVKIVDGTGLSMPDTKANQKIYPQSQRHVDCVMANHQRRTKGLEFVQSLGKEDRLLYWIKMKPCPTWLEKSQWEKVPEKLLIREVSFLVTIRGFRTKRITLATTLFNQRQYPKEDLAQLFRRRWMAELFLRDIKSTMGMDILRCKTPDMVHKELIMFMIAYNLIRSLILQSSMILQAHMDRLSFKGTLAILRQLNPPTLRLMRSRKLEETLYKTALRIIAKDIVPDRPDRQEPRARKRRPKNYQLLNKPRSHFQEIPHRNKYSKPLN